MKTAGVGSILSVMCVGFASACSSQVSIGHNDRAATADSGTPGSGGGQAWVNMGRGMTAVAGQVGAGGAGLDASRAWYYGTGGTGQYGAGGRAWVGGPSFEAQPGAWLAEDAGSGECTPVDQSGARLVDPGWAGLPPGQGTSGCGSGVLDSTIVVHAVYTVNDPGVVRSWVGFGSLFQQDAGFFNVHCTQPNADVIALTAGGTEQLTIFAVPIQGDAGHYLFGGYDIFNPTDQLSSGVTANWLLTSAPPSMVPCALRGAFMALEAGWELDPGQELPYRCTRLTLSYAHEPFLVRVHNGSDGTESILSVGDPTGPGGDELCDETADAATRLAIVKGAATVEAKPRNVHMLAGQQLILRMRAANTANVRRTGMVSVRLY